MAFSKGKNEYFNSMILAILIGLVFVAAFVYIIWVRKKERTRQKTNIYFDFPSGELFDKLDS